MGEFRYSSTHFESRSEIEVSSQLNAPRKVSPLTHSVGDFLRSRSSLNYLEKGAIFYRLPGGEPLILQPVAMSLYRLHSLRTACGVGPIIYA